MISYMVGKLAPSSTHSTKGLVKYVPGRGYFRAVPSQNGDKYVTSPPPSRFRGSKLTQGDRCGRKDYAGNTIFIFYKVVGLVEVGCVFSAPFSASLIFSCFIRSNN